MPSQIDGRNAQSGDGRDVTLFETTCRDAGYAVDFQFSASQVGRLCTEMEAAGFRYIEVGHGLGLGGSTSKLGKAAATDEAYLEAAGKALRLARYGCFFIPGVGTKEQIKTAKSLGIQFLRIGTNVTETAAAQEYVEYAKALGISVFFSFMKAYAVEPKEFAELGARVSGWGADVLYIVDSAGTLLPDQVRAYVAGLRQETGKTVGIHSHNNLQLACWNGIEAVRAGATFVDCTLRGVGRSGGNAQAELLVALLARLGYRTGVDLYKTMDLAERTFRPMVMDLRPGNAEEVQRGLSDLDVVIGLAGFHSGFLPILRAAAERHGVDLRRLILRVCEAEQVRPTEELADRIARGLGSRPD